MVIEVQYLSGRVRGGAGVHKAGVQTLLPYRVSARMGAGREGVSQLQGRDWMIVGPFISQRMLRGEGRWEGWEKGMGL